jgi:hypothetical protein
MAAHRRALFTRQLAVPCTPGLGRSAGGLLGLLQPPDLLSNLGRLLL